MTTSPFGAMEVFQPFRESRADTAGRAHYTASGGSNRLVQVLSSVASGGSSKMRASKQNAASSSSRSSSSRSPSDELYSNSAAHSNAFPLLGASTQTGHVFSDARGDSAWTSSSHSHAPRVPAPPPPAAAADGVNTNVARTKNSSDNDDGAHDIVLEEKRRRPNGEGYTVHQYLRGRLLGKGGFAKVYLCTALDTGKNYAVKVVSKANLVKARARQKVGRPLEWCIRGVTPPISPYRLSFVSFFHLAS
jgi:hypothetical protein